MLVRAAPALPSGPTAASRLPRSPAIIPTPEQEGQASGSEVRSVRESAEGNGSIVIDNIKMDEIKTAGFSKGFLTAIKAETRLLS
jgi:hypothetical protein